MKTLSWRTHEYHHQIKNPEWYWTVGIITTALVVTSIIFSNFLFALVLAIGVFSLTLFSIRKPNVVSVDIDEVGIRVERILYPYSSLESFDIDTSHRDGSRLLLKSKRVVVPLVSVPIKEHPDTEVRDFLKAHLAEETFDQGFLHHLLERLGF